jgi:poly-gamma-glutamate capsule biosynthesis protein CapA/YwtB (metallophosphatase superfamily)
MAVGDIMLGTDFPENHLPPDNGQHLLAGVATILKQADVTFGNYEGTLLSGGEPAKRCLNPKHCYVFRSPPAFVKDLTAAGFDVISLANNHARDFGDEGRLSSMTTLQQAGIQHSGQEGDYASWQINGMRIGLIAFAPFRGANNPLEIVKAQEVVRAFKAQHDLVMISMHMGAEGDDALRVPFSEEFFHGENRGDVVLFSRSMIEAGADLVLGHGPHVPRALELYNGRLIAYSLGNFCTYYGINVKGKNGLAPILKVTLFDNGEFKSGEIISARQVRPDGPRLDPSHAAAKLIAELTRLDFPDTPLEISPDGLISIRNRTGQQ